MQLQNALFDLREGRLQASARAPIRAAAWCPEMDSSSKRPHTPLSARLQTATSARCVPCRR